MDDLPRGAKARPITTVPGQAYGKATEQMNAQKAVPMASAPIANNAPPVQPAPRRPLPSLTDESVYPERGVTYGAEAINASTEEGDDTEFKASLAAYMPALQFIAARSQTSAATRSAIRILRGLL